MVVASKSTQVAVVDGNSKVVLKSVELGRDFGDSVEVLAGLSPTDRIVDNPPETLTSGDSVQVAVTTPSS